MRAYDRIFAQKQGGIQICERICALYVPVSRLLKYRPNFAFNGDVIARETVPSHETIEPKTGSTLTFPNKRT